MDKFIVLAAHRSGNTLLLNSLESHPQIQCYKRVFTLNVVISRLLMVDRPGSPFYRFRTASLNRRLDYIFRKKQLINDFMSELYRPTNGVKAVGVRVIYAEADKHPEILKWAVENEVGVIHLIRKNSLKTLVSSETARKRGLSHSTSQVNPVTIRLSPLQLKLKLDRLTQQIDKYRSRLKGTPHLEVFYESFVANREAETQRLLTFLRIDQFIPLTTNLVKLNPDSLELVIENYAEVRQSLSGTVFEKFLT
jgi:LPS sulfotransferase NodH